MLSRQNGDFKRSVVSALAALVAAAVPSLVSSPALADKSADGSAPAADTKEKSAPKAPAKHATKKTHAAKKPAAKQDSAASKDAAQKPEEAKASTKDGASAKAAPKGKKAKKTASRTGAKGKKTAKKADSDAPGRRCLGTPIAIDRGGLEAQHLALLDCHDKPLDSSAEALSVLARPWGVQKPAHLTHAKAAQSAQAVHGQGNRDRKGADPVRDRKGAKSSDPDGKRLDHAPIDLAPGVRLLDKGLLTRVDAIAKHFGGKPISLVSGYRPQSRGSLHQSGRALDLRVAGVSNEELVAFCKTLKDTGCGYYPNSSFVHVDVRNPGTGTVSWIDSSGPGEAPHYVKQWPPPPEESDTAVLPPDHEPHDTKDPWERDPKDEHTSTAPDDQAVTDDDLL
jgi:hypothetical protein